MPAAESMAGLAGSGPASAAPGPRPAGGTRQPSASPAQPLLLEVEAFGPGSLTRWRAEDGAAVEEPTGDGLRVRQPLTLSPVPAPLPLPPGTRRLTVRLTGGIADVAVALRDREGREREALLIRSDRNGHLVTPVPAGSWSVMRIAVTPREGAGIRVRALGAEVMPGGGLFGIARKQGDVLLVRIYNLGEELEHAVLEAGSGEPVVEADLGPRGAAVLRLPVAVFAGAVAPVGLSLRWRGGRAELGVR